MPRDHVAATRLAYSRSANQFASTVGTTVSPDFEAPIDLAVLAEFVALARASSGVIVDAGCGTGRVARYLTDGGLDVLGIDVAPSMIDEARRAHPDIAFDIAELTALPCETASVAAIAYWYSIITTPPDALDDVWSELDRIIAPGGVVLVAFQCGTGEGIQRPNTHGTKTDLTLFRHDPAHVRSDLESVGLSIHTFVQRQPRFRHESSDQAFTIATDAR